MSLGTETDLDRLLEIMARHDSATPTVEELMRSSGMEREAFFDAMADADVCGLIVPWTNSPGGEAVMLSSLAAKRLGLRLEETSRSSNRISYRWSPSDAPLLKVYSQDRHGVIPASQVGPDDLGDFDLLDSMPDERASDPCDLAAASERHRAELPATPEEFKKLKGAFHYRPLHLVGIREIWSGPMEKGSPCVGCHGRSLDLSEVCLRCDRCGMDFILPNLTDREIRALQGSDRLTKSDRAKPSRSRKAAGGSPAKRGRPKGKVVASKTAKAKKRA